MGSWKLAKDVDAAELSRLLRLLADALEAGQGVVSGPLAGFPAAARAFEMVAERHGTSYALKLAAKRGEDAKPESAGVRAGESRAHEADALERGREKYRQLKKLMQADYKTLQKVAEAGTMPAPDVLESFLALCQSMADIAQPLLAPRGPEAAELAQANQAFFEDARTLRRAVSARDTAAFAEVLARLERRKSACHAQFR